jgi:hypothetical protein
LEWKEYFHYKSVTPEKWNEILPDGLPAGEAQRDRCVVPCNFIIGRKKAILVVKS